MDKSVYEKNLIASVINSIEKHGGKDCLSSIILTGSFGRGEPTYSLDSSGELHLKSDAEIALVFSSSSQKKQVKELIQKVSSEFTEELNLMAIKENRVRKAYNFNFSLRVPRYKTIFMYDLFNGSRTIWGSDFIKEKTIELVNVDLYEAKRLVANRIGELTYLQNTSDEEKVNFLRMQWKGKLMLAIISAWLICEGKYVPSYHGQYDKIKADAESIEKLFGKGFFVEYEKVFLFLRENGEQYEIPDKLLESYVKNIDLYFKEKGLNSSKVNSFSRLVKYTFKYMRTGMKYGYRQYEDKILQALITDFCERSERLNEVADTWYTVLY